MSLFRAFKLTTHIPRLLLFELQSKVSVSFDIIKRLFGYSVNESESGNLLMMDAKNTNENQRFMIVGLGNFPYPDTRHSVGMKALDDFTSKLGLSWEKVQGRQGGQLCKTEMDFSDKDTEMTGGSQRELTHIYLFKPKSLMNICGGNVARTAKSLGVMSDSIYLIHDELDLALGKVSIKNGGSANGHRGVLSCVSDLKSFGLWPRESNCTDSDGIILPRLRIGIGRPSSKAEVVTYVLSSIPVHEVKVTESAVDRGMSLLLDHMAKRVKSRREKAREQKAGDDDVT